MSEDCEKGYVYVLSNPAMPGVVKIGRSKNGGKSRASALYQTGVPTPFILEFEILVDDSAGVESMAHQKLAEKRVYNGREFFAVDPTKAAETIIQSWVSGWGMHLASDPEFDAIIACRQLAQAHELSWFSVCQSIRFIDEFSLKSAVEKWSRWWNDAVAKRRAEK